MGAVVTGLAIKSPVPHGHAIKLAGFGPVGMTRATVRFLQPRLSLGIGHGPHAPVTVCTSLAFGEHHPPEALCVFSRMAIVTALEIVPHETMSAMNGM